MKISEILSTSHKAFPSLEIVPPAQGITTAQLVDSLHPLIEFGPKYINVTCHREEYEFVPCADGGFTRRVCRPRMSQRDVCRAVGEAFGIEVVPHIICAGASVEAIHSDLDAFKEMGIGNVVALRGDCTLGERRFTPAPGGYAYASQLVEGIRSYRKEEGQVYCIGVAGYPEKHFEAPNIETDIANLKKKVDAGADFVITQMFFDNGRYFDFVDRCRRQGITVPIIPGLKPLSSLRQLTLLPETFSIDIPLELSEAVRGASDAGQVYRIGTQWCIDQCRGLLKGGAPAVHFFTMGRPENVAQVIRECF